MIGSKSTLAGAAVLALGVAGSAGPAEVNDQRNQALPDVLISEIGIGGPGGHSSQARASGWQAKHEPHLTRSGQEHNVLTQRTWERPVNHRATASGSAMVLLVGITGLAGPAAADSSITTLPVVIISEFGIDMDTGGLLDIEGTFVELENTAIIDAVSLDDYTLEGCNTTTGPTHLVFDFVASELVGPGGNYLIADSTYDNAGGPAPDRRFETFVDEFLEPAGGALILTEHTTGRSHRVQWGNPHLECTGFPMAPTPTADESLHFAGGTWTLDGPSPTSS